MRLGIRVTYKIIELFRFEFVNITGIMENISNFLKTGKSHYLKCLSRL